MSQDDIKNWEGQRIFN